MTARNKRPMSGKRKQRYARSTPRGPRAGARYRGAGMTGTARRATPSTPRITTRKAMARGTTSSNSHRRNSRNNRRNKTSSARRLPLRTKTRLTLRLYPCAKKSRGCGAWRRKMIEA